MRGPWRLAAALPTSALAFALACRQSEAPEPMVPPEPAAVAAKPRQHPPLPEDPVLGAKSTAQWEEHLEEEEEHRRLCYDRERLAQHEAALKVIEGVRQRHARAKSASEAAAARAHAARVIPGVRKQLDDLDPWRNSSLVVPELEAMSKLLVEAYPDELAASAKQGAKQETAIAAELDRRAQSIRQTLERAEECEDE